MLKINEKYWKFICHRVIPIFAFFCIVAAGTSYYSIGLNVSNIQLNFEFLFVSIMIQLATVLIIILTWKANIRLNKISRLTMIEALSQVGISTLGKYAPGKVLGSVLRGIKLYEKHGKGALILRASLFEQIALIHSGIMILGFIYCYDHYPGYLPAYAIFFLLSFFLINVLKHVHRLPLPSFLSDKLSMLNMPEHNKNIIFPYFIVFIGISFAWLLSSLMLFYCARSVGVSLPLTFAVKTTAIAYLTGFAAIFVPAGIGVRDSIIATMIITSSLSTTASAISIASLHRLICTGADIAIGTISLILLEKTTPKQGSPLVINKKQ